jgi:hypothetical protein
MTLEELFKALSYGELSNLAVAVEATGTIKPAQQARIVHFANEALTRLHTRFILSEKSEVITTVEDQVEYPLVAEDSIRILALYNAYGQSYAFGASHDPDGISAPTANLIRIPNVADDGVITPGTELDVIYQAKHALLTTPTAEDVATQEITLPEVLHEALTSYIASQMYKSINTPEAQAAFAASYARYQLTCDEAERYSLVNTGTMSPNGKFGDRGWV